MSSPPPPGDHTQRFTDRVADYVKYRPSYPAGVLTHLRDLGLAPQHVIADLGSGTGLLARMFLDAGHTVFGVEPNRAMRDAGERLLGDCPGFRSVDGRAEATALPGASVDLVTAGQAFHWFDPEAARVECRRILRPGGFVALVWNERRTDSTPFLRGYEALLRRYSPEYPVASVQHEADTSLRTFFGPQGFALATFENAQEFDLPSLRGRALSSSYVPAANHPNHAPLLAALDALFHAEQSGGRVVFEYDTHVYTGTPAA